MLRFLLCFLLAAAAAACAGCVTSPTGRAQLHLFPQAEMAKMGVAAYDECSEWCACSW